MYSITVETKVLRALLLTAAKKDICYYLNGICFEFTSTGCKAISTDGHRLSVAQINRDSYSENFQVIVSGDYLKQFEKSKQKNICFEFEKMENFEHKVKIFDSMMNIQCTAIVGKYPDWERVVPEFEEQKSASYNAEYLFDAQKAVKLLGGNIFKSAIYQNG